MPLDKIRKNKIKSLINENQVRDIEQVIKTIKKVKRRVDNVNNLCKEIKNENFRKLDEKGSKEYLILDEGSPGENLVKGCQALNRELLPCYRFAVVVVDENGDEDEDEDVNDILCIKNLRQSSFSIPTTKEYKDEEEDEEEDEDKDSKKVVSYGGSKEAFNRLTASIPEFYEAYNYMISAATKLLPAKRDAEREERNAEKRKR